jgi:hypothetical protein
LRKKSTVKIYNLKSTPGMKRDNIPVTSNTLLYGWVVVQLSRQVICREYVNVCTALPVTSDIHLRLYGFSEKLINGSYV